MGYQPNKYNFRNGTEPTKAENSYQAVEQPRQPSPLENANEGVRGPAVTNYHNNEMTTQREVSHEQAVRNQNSKANSGKFNDGTMPTRAENSMQGKEKKYMNTDEHMGSEAHGAMDSEY